MDGSVIVRIFYYLLAIFILVACVAFSKWRDLTKARKLRELVSWCVVKAKHGELLVHVHDFPVWCYVSNAQVELKIPEACCVTGDDEWEFAKEILEEYQKDLIQSYFKGHLRIPKSKYVIPGDAYFLFTLYAFLSEHQCDYRFLEYDMHQSTVSYKSYGSWGGPLYDATYSLTDFSVVFHKMHYISYMYCRNSEILKDHVPAWNEAVLKEILDTRQIQLSRI